ncbi:MAG TPA: zinc ribbon domain-containing protein [Thermoleophilia bacterium]|nr:zinc ribbon domain-containing protein [Thermoleophilia bacterium]
MYCPECGHDAAEAKFCPDCGTDLTTARQALRRPAKKPAAGPPAKAQRPRTARRAAERRGEPAPGAAAQSHSVRWIWLGFAAAAVVVVALVVALGSQSGEDAPSTAAAPVAADTSGSYSELVDRANGLYDQGIAAFNKDDSAGGVEAFGAAAEVYRAAWKQQPGDPNVGTDFAVSLFYSQHHDEALQQVDVVLKANPDFQAANLNKGIFLKTEADEAKDEAKAAEFLAQAKIAFKKAASIDPASDAGKSASSLLQSL